MWEIPEQSLSLGAPDLLCSPIRTGRLRPNNLSTSPPSPAHACYWILHTDANFCVKDTQKVLLSTQSSFLDRLGSLGKYKGLKISAEFIGNSSMAAWEKAPGTHTKKVFLQEELSEFPSIYSIWVYYMLGPKRRLSFKLKNRTHTVQGKWLVLVTTLRLKHKIRNMPFLYTLKVCIQSWGLKSVG